MSLIGVVGIGILGCLSIFIVAGLLYVMLIEPLCEKSRRRKYPEYFKYFDEACELSFARGAKYKSQVERFEFKFKLYSYGLRDGECTNEFYTENMNKLLIEYQEMCTWYAEEENKIHELLVKADLYAKEHDLLWGVIF
jgi:hypothetical protein